MRWGWGRLKSDVFVVGILDFGCGGGDGGDRGNMDEIFWILDNIFGVQRIA